MAEVAGACKCVSGWARDRKDVRCTDTWNDTNEEWKDSCNRDMESVGLKVEDVMDRTLWKRELQKLHGRPQMM